MALVSFGPILIYVFMQSIFQNILRTTVKLNVVRAKHTNKHFLKYF